MSHLLLPLAALLLVPVSSSAGEPAWPSMAAAYSAARQALPQTALRDVNACFERAADPRADALKLPKRFCLRRVGTRLPAGAMTPFDDRGAALIEGTPSWGAKHISGGSRRQDGGWDLVADLFQAPERRFVCGRLNMAFAAAYFPVDAAGRPIDGPVEVRGFLMDGSPLCEHEAKSVDFEYRRLP
ncbi:MAG: hypothetical protein NTX64_12605 [Elusimicrobia bacterium]|nr:hypothetical protein [Elusimicrobiota bacterium]